ncbi:septal ring lytic transglycosylase RlpA family protein [Novosphingobium endophyticum]|uniref:septal ring lytic transglycosylase RlpA family protein n=1 Tax=Novosphingobium endophyticum TaxID=1955250 RepID=UPI001E3F0141|nr:septal ring lytic transglycosylase RlpA family protein [Novosphingobium endophyticum]
MAAVRPGNRRAGLFAAVAALVTLPLTGPVLAEDIAIADTAPALAEIAPARPIESAPTFDPIGSGVASYYGDELAGNRTASGERFDPDALTAAHRTLPFGSKVRVTYEKTGESVIVTINDRGPFHGNRVIDLSEAAAEQIGLVRAGHGRVVLALRSE